MKRAMKIKKALTTPSPSKPKRPHGRGRPRQVHPIVNKLAQVPYQKPILKEEYKYRDNFRTRRIDPERGSKYVGVSYDAVVNRWRAQMMIDKTVVNLGTYVNEEEAGVIYAKAAVQFKSPTATGIYGGLDLRAVPNQPLIGRCCHHHNNHDTSTIPYKGIKACKGRWQARVSVQGSVGPRKNIHLGTFDTMEEAAQIYANATYYLEHSECKDSCHPAVEPIQHHHANDDDDDDSCHPAVEIGEHYRRCPV